MGTKNRPAGQTVVTQQTNTAPWAPQQPYLQQAFGGAQNLYQNYTPQYYPNSTYAAPTANQLQGLQTLGGLGQDFFTAGTPFNSYYNDVLGTSNNLVNGQYLANNPAIQALLGMSGTNVGENNLGTGTLQNLAGGGLSGYYGPQGELAALGGQNAAYLNPAFGSLAGLAAGGVPGLSGIQGLAGSSIAPSQAALAAGVLPAGMDLGAFASGAMNDPRAILQNAGGRTLKSFASGAQTDPFLSNVAQSTLANVVPSIESQFINGGDLSSPQAAFATSQGASAALAPIISNALLQEQQNQLQAGGALQNAFGNAALQEQANQLAGGQALGNLGINASQALQNLSLNPAQLMGNLALGGAGLQSQTGLGLGNQLVSGQGLQQNALQGAGNLSLGLGGLQLGAGSQLGQQALQGAGLQTQQLANAGQQYNQGVQQILQGLGMFPQTMQGLFGPAQMQAQAGAEQQQLNQGQLNDLINRFNFQQTLPYQQLGQFLGSVGGNYGQASSGSQSTPFYQNQPANIMSGLLGAGALGNMFLPGGIGGALGGLFGGGAAAGAFPGLGGGLTESLFGAPLLL